MISEAIDRIVNLAFASMAKPMERNGLLYVPAAMELRALPVPSPTPLKVRSLTGIVDFLRENRDSFDMSEIFVHVESPWQVSVRGLIGDDAQRDTFMVATPPIDERNDGFYGRQHAQEDMIIQLQTRFRHGPNLAEVLRLVGTLTAEAVKTGIDDGVSQEVATSAGRVRKGIETFKNPAMLVPRRSFPEVTLDEVPFILRFTGGSADRVPTVALHEADGGAWQIDAMQKVCAWLSEKQGQMPLSTRIRKHST